jgi:hypothetical protein
MFLAMCHSRKDSEENAIKVFLPNKGEGGSS